LFFRFLPVILFFLLISQSLAQDKYSYHPWQMDTVFVAEKQFSNFKFPKNHRILDQSIRVFLNSRELEYLLEYRYQKADNTLTFFAGINPSDTVKIVYQILPVLLRRQYMFFQLDTLATVADSSDSITIVRPVFENPFAGVGGGLKRSGSIVRGVNIGSNKDMTLNSGLNLQLSGKLTEDLEIVAALTDASTPIQPEGNTQTLREIDQVFIKFNSPWVNGVLGDFNLNYGGTQFGSYSRKLQGISVTGNYSDFELGGTVASTRGFYHFYPLIGQESNQGPYKLVGKNGEKDIIVLAGTERVWIDGKKLIRGENNDYVIEYSNGQITFTNKQLITSESRIEIDFEYFPATQKYTRNVYSGLSTGSFFNKSLNFRVSYFNEGDDPQKILESEGSLSEEELDAIREAGDDPLAAYVDGATYAGDSLGFYIQVDTTIQDSNYVYYKYVGQFNGDYNVRFSSVGQGNGDYTRESLGIYRWVGIKRGAYLPIDLLPLPNEHQLLDMQLEYQIGRALRVKAEAAVSRLDKNKLSPLGDKNNQGHAYKLSARLDPVTLTLGGKNLGDFFFNLDGKSVDEKFQPIDRINQPDLVTYWNLLPEVGQINEEQSVEFKSSYLPWQWLTLSGQVGKFQRSNFNSLRYHGNAKWDKQNWLRGFLTLELLNSKQGVTRIDWYKQKGDVNKDIGVFQPGLLYHAEDRKIRESGVTTGFSFRDLGGRIKLIDHSILSGELQYNERKDEIYDPNRNGAKIPQATSKTGRFRLNLAEWNRTSGYVQVVIREKDYTSFFENEAVDSVKLRYLEFALQDTVWQDRKTNLIEMMLKNFQWNRAVDIQWQYRLSVGQVALKEKVYIDVGEGRGNFRYDESLGEYVPDPNGQYILFIVPSGKFEPMADLGTSLRLVLDPRRILKKPVSILSKFVSELSSDSYFRIEEVSRDTTLSNLYFLRLSTFQGPNTVRGSKVFNQDLHFLRRNRDHSFRFRYRYRDDLFNQYLDPNDNEKRLKIERSLFANYRILEKLKAQSEFKNILTLRENKANIIRDRDINALIFLQNFSFRPDLTWEFGIETEYGLETDDANQKDLEISYLRSLFRANYALLGKGKISTSFDYQMVNTLRNPTGASIPFEMARGKKEGVSKNWQVRGEYTIAENVVVSLYYLGRDDAQFEKIIHSGQAEIRAYF